MKPLQMTRKCPKCGQRAVRFPARIGWYWQCVCGWTEDCEEPKR